MQNKLEPIILQKKFEVADLHQRLKNEPHHPIFKLLNGTLEIKRAANFKNALNSSSLTVIAEIKRKSPSRGIISPISDPVELAKRYKAAGANALSILTDKTFFGGNINDLIKVANALYIQQIPIIRKDFIIDKLQIAEAVISGASAVLLIVAVLGKKTKALLEFARSLHIDVLVEIHDSKELEIALECGADIIGVNNRDLNTFIVDPERATKLIPEIPKHVIKVAESGIHCPELAKKYSRAGFNAVLIGEALVTSKTPEHFIRECHQHD